MIELDIHSPVEEIKNPLFINKGIQVFVKRDDMIHPFISGNKWRKLKHLLRDAFKLNKNHLVTFGGAYSNHLLATACAGAKFGFQTTGFVRGEEVKNETLTLCRLFGMQLIFIDRESYKHKKSLFDQHFQDHTQAYFIDEGGAGVLAIKGCAELIDELPETYDHIFCAAGTGTTASGIIKGIIERSIPTLTHVIPVLKGAEFLKTEIEENSGSNTFEIHTGYHFGGYAKTDEELLTFIKNFCSTCGILIEPVYTGKMFFSLFDLISKDHFNRGSKILAIHTGGLSGISGMINKFNY
jgi:1-aminocyclopropane-1-carboxylate deaminase